MKLEEEVVSSCMSKWSTLPTDFLGPRKPSAWLYDFYSRDWHLTVPFEARRRVIYGYTITQVTKIVMEIWSTKKYCIQFLTAIFTPLRFKKRARAKFKCWYFRSEISHSVTFSREGTMIYFLYHLLLDIITSKSHWTKDSIPNSTDGEPANFQDSEHVCCKAISC